MSKKKGSSFFHRIKFKYKLSILNENTLEEVWRIRLSWLNVFLVSFATAVLYFFFIAFLIIKTPLRTFLPGYSDNNILSQQVIRNAASMDSIREVVRVRGEYMEMLQNVCSGNIPIDSTTSVDSLLKKDYSKEILEPSEKENKFRKQFEREEKYNTGMVENAYAKLNYLMFRPANGVVIERSGGSSKQNILTVQMENASAIHSLLDGVVVYVSRTSEGLFEMHIQHNNGMTSYYKFALPFIKEVGDNVHAGEVISVPAKDSANTLIFELWENGKSLNPEDYILFN